MGRIVIQGNEVNGYCVVQKVDDAWEPITRRYLTYDEASKALSRIEPAEPKKHETFVREEFRRPMRSPEYRVWCSEGDFEDKALTREEAKHRGAKHEDEKSGLRPTTHP